MKVYNKDKTIELKEYDLEKGYLKNDTMLVHYPEVQAVEEQYHRELIKEYDNGGKSYRRVIDVEGVEYKPARDEEEEIYVYIPYTEEELLENKKNELRNRREQECFSIINRGSLWYATLTDEQVEELNKWYLLWLDVTLTLIQPVKPSWLE